jgi:hypothetical protein
MSTAKGAAIAARIISLPPTKTIFGQPIEFLLAFSWRLAGSVRFYSRTPKAAAIFGDELYAGDPEGVSLGVEYRSALVSL